MTTERKDGGPAFPSDPGQLMHMSETGVLTPMGFSGMSLRDWFAGQALATMQLANSWSDNPLYWEGVTRSAYVCADAMLAERQKP